MQIDSVTTTVPEGDGSHGDHLEEVNRRTLNRVAQQRCRARRKQKYEEMEKQVEMLQRQLLHYEATKTEAEGLMIENAMLRRVSGEQAHHIQALKHQLSEALHKDNPYSVVSQHGYDMTGLRDGWQSRGCSLDSYRVARRPLPVPRFEPYHTTSKRRCMKEYSATSDGESVTQQRSSFSEMLSDVYDLDADVHLYQDVSFLRDI